MGTVYLLKTGDTSGYPDNDRVIGIFDDLEALKAATIKAAKNLWDEDESNFAYNPCKKWVNDGPCTKNCGPDCEHFYSEEDHLKTLRRHLKWCLNPMENVFIIAMEMNEEETKMVYQLRPISSYMPLASELFGGEVYSYELPEALRNLC